MSLTVAVVTGSLRLESFNRRLAQALVALPEAQGADFAFVEIGTLPLYDQDDDGAPTASVIDFKAAIAQADAVLFVSPEYNRSIPGVLKNALDHGSRPYGQSVWGGKPAGVIGTSPGATGTALAQQHLRNVLAYLDMPVLAQPEAFITWKDDLIGPDGTIAERSRGFLGGWMKAFLTLAQQHQRG